MYFSTPAGANSLLLSGLRQLKYHNNVGNQIVNVFNFIYVFEPLVKRSLNSKIVELSFVFKLVSISACFVIAKVGFNSCFSRSLFGVKL